LEDFALSTLFLTRGPRKAESTVPRQALRRSRTIGALFSMSSRSSFLRLSPKRNESLLICNSKRDYHKKTCSQLRIINFYAGRQQSNIRGYVTRLHHPWWLRRKG